MNRIKFKLKLTGWCGTCSYRTQFKFMSSYDNEKVKLKKNENNKQKDLKKEFDKLSVKEKDDHIKYKLKSHKQGIYQCLDCSELKVFELPERI